MKVLIIPGHGNGDPGAIGNGYREADLTREMTALIREELSKYCVVDALAASENWYINIIKQGKYYNFKPYDYVLEVHLNSSEATKEDGITTGTEIFVTREEKTVTVEEKMVANIAKLGFKNRGVKRKNFDLINYIKKQGVSSALLEVCFISDSDDMKLYSAKKREIAAAVAKGIADGYKLEANTLEAACKVLSNAGIINSPDYWAKGAGYSDSNTVLLIKKFADYVKRKEK